MLVQKICKDQLYKALIERDASYEGRVYVGVTSTGVFCRLTCPARKPKPENCRFYETVGECVEAGFRPCKRCSPLKPAADSDPVVARLLEVVAKAPGKRWRESDIERLGLDPSTVRRAFLRHFGVTFLEWSRMTRLRDAFKTLNREGAVIGAQLDAGFQSGSGLRDAFARLIGVAPGSLKKGGILRADWIETPLGHMAAVADKEHLHLLEFIDRKALPTEFRKLLEKAKGDLGIGRYQPTDQIEDELRAYFNGEEARFDTPLAYHGTSFSKQVWTALRQVPAGETRSYSDIARSIGRPTSVRAVARANGANQIAIAIPCHRVIGSDGSMMGYGGGLWRKQKLIELEAGFARKSSATH